jgi:hypothetical protein
MCFNREFAATYVSWKLVETNAVSVKLRKCQALFQNINGKATMLKIIAFLLKKEEILGGKFIIRMYWLCRTSVKMEAGKAYISRKTTFLL